MPQPNEYVDLTNRGFFTHEKALPGATDALLQSAYDHLAASRQLSNAGLTTPALTVAYAGLSQLFRAVFEFREVRPVEGCWSTATLVVCRDLGMNVAEQCFITALHDASALIARNSSFPSRSLAEATKSADLLEKYMPAAFQAMSLLPTQV